MKRGERQEFMAIKRNSTKQQESERKSSTELGEGESPENPVERKISTMLEKRKSDRKSDRKSNLVGAPNPRVSANAPAEPEPDIVGSAPSKSDLNDTSIEFSQCKIKNTFLDFKTHVPPMNIGRVKTWSHQPVDNELQSMSQIDDPIRVNLFDKSSPFNHLREHDEENEISEVDEEEDLEDDDEFDDDLEFDIKKQISNTNSLGLEMDIRKVKTWGAESSFSQEDKEYNEFKIPSLDKWSSNLASPRLISRFQYTTPWNKKNSWNDNRKQAWTTESDWNDIRRSFNSNFSRPSEIDTKNINKVSWDDSACGPLSGRSDLGRTKLYKWDENIDDEDDCDDNMCIRKVQTWNCFGDGNMSDIPEAPGFSDYMSKKTSADFTGLNRSSDISRLNGRSTDFTICKTASSMSTFTTKNRSDQISFPDRAYAERTPLAEPMKAAPLEIKSNNWSPPTFEMDFKKTIGVDARGVIDKPPPRFYEEGRNPATTMMIRNYPRRCTQAKLLQRLDKTGFANTYDFVYLPFCLEKKTNLGYGFVNFCTSTTALEFFFRWHKRWLDNKNKGRSMNVSVAFLQGFKANVERVVKEVRIGKILNPKYQPIVYEKSRRVSFLQYIQAEKIKDPDEESDDAAESDPNTFVVKKVISGLGQATTAPHSKPPTFERERPVKL